MSAKWANGLWDPIDELTLRASLLKHSNDNASARLLLVSRAEGSVFATLDGGEADQPIATRAAMLGWPDVARAPRWPTTILDHLEARSNDYVLLDLASTALGLGSLVHAEMPAVPASGGVSIVLPAFGVHDVLAPVLDAVVECVSQLPPATPWECIVVDDANEPPVQLPPSLPPEVSVIRTDVQLHCGGARNMGLRHARYEIVAFCDADTALQPNYLTQHLARQKLAPKMITVSCREYLTSPPVPARPARTEDDTRVYARYAPGRLGLVPVTTEIEVRPLQETREFRDFGYRRLLGPVDLPFMVKGSNVVLETRLAREILFPPDFVGWGPEDICFAAKAIACGAFVVPVLATGVFHFDHPPRSGGREQRDAELTANLRRYERHLREDAEGPWVHTTLADDVQ